ncbi:mitochondrial ribonuclease P catalytic subunit [Athalia rosae]|uniref:mitochondrial ribonuclease P catalytic subunit n=1 Tax=Athalia rosae TaxID=37344 RepID=UPI00203487BD|nr:mitochondrial ribonuclease P catalytic subunit [Athalia rosae]
MALYKSSSETIIKHSRWLSTQVQRTKVTLFDRLQQVITTSHESPIVDCKQWSKFREDLLKPPLAVKEIALDSTILQYCISSNDLPLGKSYQKYLRESESNPSLGFVGKYFQLLYNNMHHLTHDDKKDILTMYDNLRVAHPLLDASTAECCILGLSLTERWKESFELLEMLKVSCTGSVACYSAIAQAAFYNSCPEIGWKYLNEMVTLERNPKSAVYITYVDYCTRTFTDRDVCVAEIGKLFNFFAEHSLAPFKDAIDYIQVTFKKLGWTGVPTVVDKKGVCQTCGHQLSPLNLSAEDYSMLLNAVVEKALVGNDVYHRTTPVELKKFQNFINRTKPYDVVVDGLNVAYKNRQVSNNPAQKVATLVRQFVSQNKIVLILGRKHMMQWNANAMKYIKNNSYLFLTDDLSSDDLCLLYATFASGPQTQFVSSDLMRQHKFLLQDPALKKLFKHWQMASQRFPVFRGSQLHITPPLNYLPVAQSSENHWHIPYQQNDAPLTDTYEPPAYWLCLHKLGKRRN